MTVNGDSDDTSSLSFGKGGGSGALYAFPVTFVQLTHFRITHATSCLADGIQNICLRCWFCIWMSDISKDVSLFFFGNRYASSGSGALFMHPPHRINPSLSRYRRNWRTKWCLDVDANKLKIHYILAAVQPLLNLKLLH